MSINGKPFMSISASPNPRTSYFRGRATDEWSLQLVRWQVVTAFNIISEAAIFGMSIYLVWGLRMPLSQKSIVITAFGMRLP
jgi:hypothetical protein